MRMSIKLDDLELIKRVDDPQTRVVKEIRSIYNITTSDRRKVEEHKIPSSEGSILSDLGRIPIKISFDGEFQGPDAKASLESLRAKFKVGKPLPFSSDITNIADVNQVLIEELHINDIGGIPNRYNYSMVLREYRPPPPQAQPPPSQEEQAQQQVQQQANDELDSVYVEGRITDKEGKPLKGVTVIVSSTEGEWKEPAVTDDQGYYKTKSKFKPGKYTVAFELKGYKRDEKKVDVKSSKGGE